MATLDEIILKYRKKGQTKKKYLFDGICSTLAQYDFITSVKLDKLDIEALREAEEYENIAELLEELEAFRKAKENINGALQNCFSTTHCESNEDYMKGLEDAYTFCIKQMEVNQSD